MSTSPLLSIETPRRKLNVKPFHRRAPRIVPPTGKVVKLSRALPPDAREELQRAAACSKDERSAAIDRAIDKIRKMFPEFFSQE